jgi:hypothetical protein
MFCKLVGPKIKLEDKPIQPTLNISNPSGEKNDDDEECIDECYA